MPDQVFEPLRSLLPEFRHYSVEYGSADSQAIMLDMIQAAALAARSEPLIVAGWSLGGLAALRLAAEGLADGLVLLASTEVLLYPAIAQASRPCPAGPRHIDYSRLPRFD